MCEILLHPICAQDPHQAHQVEIQTDRRTKVSCDGRRVFLVATTDEQPQPTRKFLNWLAMIEADSVVTNGYGL